MKDITLLEYNALKDKSIYSPLLFLKGKNLFFNNKLDYNLITYDDVRKLFKLSLTAETIEESFYLFEIAFGVNKIQYWQSSVLDYFNARNFLIKYLKDTQERETKLLKSISIDDGVWQQAGGSTLDAFSNLLPLVQLGEIYSIFPYDMSNKPYQQILTLLVLHKRKATVQNRYEELKNKRK
jgi:hypothetical protein